jgi:hypothetical protein
MSPKEPGQANSSDLRSLRSKIAGSNDERILRVLEIVDNLDHRGDADSLIAPLRHRLAEIGPRRKLSLGRLLFTPLNPLIVAVHEWTPDSPAVPRTAIAPIVRQVQRHLGKEQTARINATASQYSTTDALASVVSIGSELWCDAAVMLADAGVPDGWHRDSGLRDGDYPPLVKAIAGLLSQAAPLLRIAIDARTGINPEAADLLTILAAVAPAGSQATAMLMVLGMHWLPRADLFLKLADQLARTSNEPGFAKVADSAVEFLLSDMGGAPITGSALGAAASDVKRCAALVEDLMAASAHKPKRQSQVEAARKKVDAACRDRFATELTTNLLARSGELASADADNIEQFENTARELRRFETAARRLGGGEHYDRQLRQAVQALRPQAQEDSLATVSRIRLIEILCGSDAAMAALAGPRGAV